MKNKYLALILSVVGIALMVIGNLLSSILVLLLSAIVVVVSIIIAIIKIIKEKNIVDIIALILSILVAINFVVGYNKASKIVNDTNNEIDQIWKDVK